MTPEEGQFELGGLIGEGAFGKVFECFDKKDGKKFAMKKIKLRKLSKDDRDSAETEARLLTSLQNEYILHAVTAFQENEILCIVTDFCDQGDLAQFLEERKGESLDEQRIVEWFRQICSALEYLHGKDVLHRDIKTQNIFLTGNEMTAKLGDFGVAKVLESPTQKVLSFRGSPYYMSPEIYAYKPYNSKTDIWALGVCVYEMVALKLPFEAPQMQQLVYKIIHDELPPLPEGYSLELIEIIEKMMCREMDRRPSASELLQNALFKNHNSSKVEIFLPNKKTTRRKLSTNEDMDRTISDNTLRININAREYDSYLPSKPTVSNSEIITLDTELPEASGSETSSEDEKSFVSKITADKALSTFRPSIFRSFMRSLMAGATESDGRNRISSPPKGDKEENIFQYIKEDCVHEDETGASAISEENWHLSSYTQRQDSDAVLQQEFDEFKEGKENEKDEEERTLMDEKVQRRFQSRENNRKPEYVGHGKPRSGRPIPGLDSKHVKRPERPQEGKT